MFRIQLRNDVIYCWGDEIMTTLDLVNLEFRGVSAYCGNTDGLFYLERNAINNSAHDMYILYSKYWSDIMSNDFYPVYVLCLGFKMSLYKFVSIYPKLIECIKNR
jgi:hypothetical protein